MFTVAFHEHLHKISTQEWQKVDMETIHAFFQANNVDPEYLDSKYFDRETGRLSSEGISVLEHLIEINHM